MPGMELSCGRNEKQKSPHENLWPTVLDHYDTYWNKYSVIVPDNDDLEVCQICDTTPNDEYTYDNTEQLMEGETNGQDLWTITQVLTQIMSGKHNGSTNTQILPGVIKLSFHVNCKILI